MADEAAHASEDCGKDDPLGGGTFIQFHAGYPVCLFGCRVEVVVDILPRDDGQVVASVDFLITLKDGGLAICAPGVVTGVPPNGTPLGGFHFYFNCHNCSGNVYTVFALARDAGGGLLEIISQDTNACP